jgi:alkylation response protein AidB-like acyl-CoA dehydrogenase
VAAALARAGIDVPWLGTFAVGEVLRSSPPTSPRIDEAVFTGDAIGSLVDRASPSPIESSVANFDRRVPRWTATISADRVSVEVTDNERSAPLAVLHEEQAVRAFIARVRLRLAAHLGGVVRGALDEAVIHAHARHQFGRPLAAFQSVAFALAEIEARTRALEALVEEIALQLDAGENRMAEAAGTLALAGTFARRATATTLHLHGAAGLTASASAGTRYLEAAAASIMLGAPPLLRAEAATALWPPAQP